MKKQLKPQEGVSVIDRNLGADNRQVAQRVRIE